MTHQQFRHPLGGLGPARTADATRQRGGAANMTDFHSNAMKLAALGAGDAGLLLGMVQDAWSGSDLEDTTWSCGVQSADAGIFIVDGDPNGGGTEIQYTPGMAPTGSDFVKDTIRSLDALLLGPGGTPDSGTTPIADIDFQVFADLRKQGSGAPASDPNIIRDRLNSPAARSNPAYIRAVSAGTVDVHGNVVGDYVGCGQLSDEKVVIAHARYNPADVGRPQHVSGTVYWNPHEGMCVNPGTHDERRAPPMMVLKHELTHAWMDHFFAQGNLIPENEEDAPALHLEGEEAAAWRAELKRREAENMAKLTKDPFSEDTRQLPLHHAQTPWSPDVYEAIRNAYDAEGAIDSDRMLVNPNHRSQAPYGETYPAPGGGDVAYYEEELVTDNEYQSVEKLREWAEEHAPELLKAGGGLSELGNRTQYDDAHFYKAADPLSTRRAP